MSVDGEWIGMHSKEESTVDDVEREIKAFALEDFQFECIY